MLVSFKPDSDDILQYEVNGTLAGEIYINTALNGYKVSDSEGNWVYVVAHYYSEASSSSWLIGVMQNSNSLINKWGIYYETAINGDVILHIEHTDLKVEETNFFDKQPNRWNVDQDLIESERQEFLLSKNN